MSGSGRENSPASNSASDVLFYAESVSEKQKNVLGLTHGRSYVFL